MSLWATKSIAGLRAEADATSETSLKRALGPLNLVTLGIGAIIGAGIFVLTGQAAALYAGPAVPISMGLVGIACAFAGLCYAEMASAVPVAGSAYTYAYATMGELVAWIIGWDLVLEYAAGRRRRRGGLVRVLRLAAGPGRPAPAAGTGGIADPVVHGRPGGHDGRARVRPRGVQSDGRHRQPAGRSSSWR